MAGTPTLGIARLEVASNYGSAFLSLGTHQVTVVAIDSGGRSTTFGPRTIVVQ